ncbi:UNVERIFIED_CONTAM: Protoporphyrinogen oxidase, chloroplastic [Sesamum angustifolium]|uniref:Protoporphyrinogen oxidase n=1 Tax=Sesamum angustifolium TaxID=2727405 RepID=A0AAW2IQN3_9LAMI
MKAAFGKVWKLEKNGGSIIGGSFKAIQEKSSSPRAPRDPRLPKPKGQTVGSFKRAWSCCLMQFRPGNKVKLSWRLTTITTLENGGYLLTYETPSGMVSLRSRSVVMTVPSYVASTILRPLSAVAADALLKLYYPPVAAVTISYPKEAIRKECLIDGELKGFGQLHPRSQGVETLGTIYSSSLFPNRAPAGRVLLLNYIGGATNPGITLKTKSQLVDSVDRDLRKMLINTNAPDPLVLGVRVWPQAIPQFMIGHLDVLDTAQNALSYGGFKGLFLGGNYVSGVALGRCVEGAYDVAEEVTDYLSQYVYR